MTRQEVDMETTRSEVIRTARLNTAQLVLLGRAEESVRGHLARLLSQVRVEQTSMNG